MLDKAASDPAWKQRFLDEPEAAIGEFPEYQRLQEMAESGATTPAQAAAAPPEAMPALPWEEYDQLQRSLGEKVLDKAASDPAWKQHLLDEPQAALREVDFPEARRVRELKEEEAEVRGQALGDYEVVGSPYLGPDDVPKMCTRFKRPYPDKWWSRTTRYSVY